MPHIRRVTVILLLSITGAHASMLRPEVLMDLSLEELSNIEITSVSRRTERLSDAAASVFVITADDIRRSTATTLPEVLRLAPNLHVARIDGGQYAISARGFNNAIANKLLVLLDGRTIYAPFYSGVLWEQQDLVLEDIERIEVISGPGGTLWGTNAVNGTINIVTRSAAQTQGAMASVTAGTGEAVASLRYGFQLGEGHVRVYAKSVQLDNTESPSGVGKTDGWRKDLVGFRADWSGGLGTLTMQGNALKGTSQAGKLFGILPLPAPEVSEANLLAGWSKAISGQSDVRVQFYYSNSERDDMFSFRPRENILDLEFQHGLTAQVHRFLWGGGYRESRDEIRPGLFFGFVPAKRRLSWANMFAQDTIQLGASADVTLGMRVEKNPYTGLEGLPNARFRWKIDERNLVWTAASRAVRSPSRLDRDLRLPPTPPHLIAGGPDFASETANVYEAGFRTQASPSTQLSITAFHYDWDDLRSGQPAPNAQVQNMIHGQTAGVEAWGAWQPARWVRLSAGASTLQKSLDLKTGSTDPEGPRNLGNDPDYQWMLRSLFMPSDAHEIDVQIRRVASLPDPKIAGYTAVDVRLGWRVSRQLDVALLGRDLFDPSHTEFNASPLKGNSEIGRSVFLQLTWKM